MKVDATRRAVFDTAELLEEIMLNLPAKTVFGVQRVCRQFRDIVSNSPRLRRYLNLLPSSDDFAEAWVLRRNSRVAQATKFYFTKNNRDGLSEAEEEEAWSEDSDEEADDRDEYSTPYMPVRLSDFAVRPDAGSPTEPNPASRMSLKLAGEHVHLLLSGSVIAPTASWRAVYLTKPPCHDAEISVRWIIKSQPPTYGAVRQCVFSDSASGLTLGEIIDAALNDRGVVPVHGEGSSKEHSVKSNRELVDVPARLEAKCDKAAIFGDGTTVALEGMVVPSEEEWADTTGYGDSRGANAAAVCTVS